MSDGACGNGCASRAETLITGGFAGLFEEDGVVFLRKVRWISFADRGTGITPESLKMRVLSGKRYNPAEPILFGKSVYCLAKPVLCDKSDSC